MDKPLPPADQPKPESPVSPGTPAIVPPSHTEPEVRHADGSVEHPLVHSQPHALPVRGIMVVIVAIIVIGAVVLYLDWIFFRGNEHHQLTAKASTYPLASASAGKLPPEPRLEPLDRTNGIDTSNVYDRQLAKEQQLNSYGPTDEPGFVHIPIQEAMKMIASKLPVRAQTSQANLSKSDGLLDGGEPNSGRVFQRTQR
jgi:hypothetical protein